MAHRAASADVPLPSTSSGGRRLAVTVALFAIVGCTVGTRSNSAGSYVFAKEDKVRLLGVDAYYHLRHAQFAARHFPRLQRWDVGAGYPTGERARYAGLYDLGVAAAARAVARGVPRDETLRRVMAWTPVVLAGVALLVLFGVVREAAGTSSALIGCTVLTLYPGGFLSRTLLGFADHHAAEVVLFLLSAWAIVSCGRPGPKTTSRRRRLAVATGRAAPLVAFYFTWPGAPLVVVVLGAAATLACLASALRGAGPSRCAGELAYVGAGVVVFAGTIGFLAPDLVMNARLHEVQLGVMLASLSAPLLVAPVLRRPGWVGAPALALLAGGAVLFRYFGPEVPDLFGPKTEVVTEHFPPTSRAFLEVFGWPGVAALTAPAVALSSLFDAALRRRALVLAGIGWGWIVMWWRTHDYDYVIPPLVAALCAMTLAPLLRRPAVRRRAAAAVALVVLLVVPHVLRWHPPPWATARLIESLAVLDDGWEESLAWLARATPAPVLPVDAYVPSFGEDFRYPPGAYGVGSAWSFGNFVAALGRRVPVASQGASRVAARAFLASTEEAALAAWYAGCEPGEYIRYVIVDGDTVGDHFASMAGFAGQSQRQFIERSPDGLLRAGPAYRRTHAARLYHEAGSGLHHFRLVYQSPSRTLLYYALQTLPGTAPGARHARLRMRSDPVGSTEECAARARRMQQAPDEIDDLHTYDARCAPSVRIFEVVRSARVLGRAPAGTRVAADLVLRSTTDGDAFAYRQEVRTRDDGRFVLVLPYATEPVPASAVVAEGPYRVSFARPDGAASPGFAFDLIEAQVESGAVLELGDLARPPGEDAS